MILLHSVDVYQHIHVLWTKYCTELDSLDPLQCNNTVVVFVSNELYPLRGQCTVDGTLELQQVKPSPASMCSTWVKLVLYSHIHNIHTFPCSIAF